MSDQYILYDADYRAEHLGWDLIPKRIKKRIIEGISETCSKGRIGKGTALTACSVRGHHMLLHNTLECAVKWGLITRNPADAVTPPRSQHTEMHT